MLITRINVKLKQCLEPCHTRDVSVCVSYNKNQGLISVVDPEENQDLKKQKCLKVKMMFLQEMLTGNANSPHVIQITFFL